jgi:hypothetical protein
MTWGRGLDVGEIAAQGDAHAVAAQGNDAQNQIDAHVPPAQGNDAPESDTPSQNDQEHDAQHQDEQQSQVEQQGTKSIPPVPPTPPVPPAQTDDGDAAASEHAETGDAAPRNADAADGSGQETETIHHEEQ